MILCVLGKPVIGDGYLPDLSVRKGTAKNLIRFRLPKHFQIIPCRTSGHHRTPDAAVTKDRIYDPVSGCKLTAAFYHLIKIADHLIRIRIFIERTVLTVSAIQSGSHIMDRRRDLVKMLIEETGFHIRFRILCTAAAGYNRIVCIDLINIKLCVILEIQRYLRFRTGSLQYAHDPVINQKISAVAVRSSDY